MAKKNSRGSESSKNSRKRGSKIDKILLSAGIVNTETLVDLKGRTNKDVKLEQLIVEEGIISETDLMQLLSEKLNISIVDLYTTKFSKRTLKLISKRFAQKKGIIPIEKKDGKLIIATADPLDYGAMTDIRMLTGLQVIPKFATRSAIGMAIAQNYGGETEVEDWMLEGGSFKREENKQNVSEENAPIIKLINTLLEDAVEKQASDIHLDPQEKELVVRSRIDGALIEERRLPKNIQNAVVSRIKIMSALDITENRLPQDGRAKIKVGERAVDLRISILPTVYGEKIVIRVLEMSTSIASIQKLNFCANNFEKYKKMIYQPHGLILITGPTGSGKSSTLYATLGELNRSTVNIITVEDPVEYQLQGINQVQVNSQVGLTFASGLRSILRQDPDIVMLGEIRDNETAEMAVRASMTGHLVLSTLHTNDAIDSVNRLIDMDVDPFLVATSLTGVVSQRLIRTICPRCKTEKRISEEEIQFLNKYNLHATILYEGKGCSACNMSGFKGRTAIQELFEVTSEMKGMITKGVEKDDILKKAKENQMKSLLEDGLEKAIVGQTTITEVLRVASDH